MAHLGFIGLGAMGGRVTKRLLDAGHTVTGYNRTRSKAQWLLDAGMRWGDSPRAVAEAADILFTMVTNTNALHQVFHGPDGILSGLSAGKIYIDMSTVSPSASRHLATQVAAKEAHMLDSPVSGSVITLEQGKLSLMVGGEKAIFEQVLPILQDIGPTVNYVGENGLAVLMKIAINLNLQVQIEGFYEGLLLAVKGGISLETALEVMLNSVVASPSLKYRTPFILNMPEEAWFDVNMMQKDMLLAEELGRQLDVALPSVALSNQLLTAARAQGLAKHDFAIVYKVLARMSGIDL
ncbi:2-hydroxy-3-oxopropionate reductase [Ktedonobacter sp. SOSP1-85]|uniref:NAD(P)-dependent oxidoreductase n=1 Tax=Ktedonobacter sp. SOSP1-85 TaxID=2778367 RepID=UPI00191533DB|nr:NAD(P)-dependent oxidoreductase [Ktedonobacter sp. SOSP1-85]GHO72548.1 2-hydroxy-3-oxopropionate reductase [Ktedonobacter sp. SOSP1-85]